ncbi:hypothetical protein HOP50_08g52570 [Chloropicon primus]|nr:hypothetical protein HOP50_08g52570 [Chloropicon primus]
MDVDGECVHSFLMGSTTIFEEESDSEEDSGVAGSSFQPEQASAKVTMKTGKRKGSLRDAIYRVLQEVGGSLQVKEILGLIWAKKLYVFRRMDGSLSTDDEKMRNRVSSTCAHSPLFVRTARGVYAIAKKYFNRSTADNLNEQDSNAATATTNNNMTTSSPSPYALDLREALESGLMTEEYAQAVQEALRYDSKSPEKKKSRTTTRR